MQQLRDFVIKMWAYGFILCLTLYNIFNILILMVGLLCYGIWGSIKKCRRKRNRVTAEQATELARFSIPTYSRSRMCDHEEE